MADGVTQASVAADRLRLVSWNVRSLRDGTPAVAAVLAAAAVDVALLQEAPRLWRWRSSRAALAREAGLVVAGANRVGGLVALTSLRTWVLGQEFSPLTPTPRLHRRALLTVQVSVAGLRPWRLATTHLGLDPDERLRHAGEIRQYQADGGEPPDVVTGDLNEPPGAPAWAALAEGRSDAFATGGPHHEGPPTFPSADPRRRIDAVLVAPGVEVLAAEVLDDPAARSASDHLPLVVTLRRGRPGQSGRR